MSLLLLFGGYAGAFVFEPATYGGDDNPAATYSGDDASDFTYGGDDVPTATYGGD